MIDVDRFKGLNDTFGHAIGDHVLRAVAGAIAGAVREDDVPTRFGGEEFAVLLRNPSEGIAVEVGERVRRAVAALDLRRLGVPGVSVSVGVAVAAAARRDDRRAHRGCRQRAVPRQTLRPRPGRRRVTIRRAGRRGAASPRAAGAPYDEATAVGRAPRALTTFSDAGLRIPCAT